MNKKVNYKLWTEGRDPNQKVAGGLQKSRDGTE